MAEREVVGRQISDEDVIRILLEGEKPAPAAVPPKPPGAPLGSIGLALEEIGPGDVGTAVFPGVGAVTVEAIELVHIYANVLVIVEPNIVKEYGSQSASIKAPSRSVEDMNDITNVIDKTITAEEEVDVLTLLEGRVPRFIRILVNQTCTLAFQTPRTERRTYPEGLTADLPIEITNEAWIRFWVIPPASTSLRVYISTSSAVGKE